MKKVLAFVAIVCVFALWVGSESVSKVKHDRQQIDSKTLAAFAEAYGEGVAKVK